ncbi:MAG: hypothetical protein JJ895_08795 [Balneolaceae bacterium]|nr:hypothetical protein [Balneolaceae bacterium]
MKEIIVKVPDEKLGFVIELLDQLGLENDFEISEAHKKIVLERIESSVEEDLIPWEEARKKLRTEKK